MKIAIFVCVIGGSRKISGIHYTDDLEILNRSRQLIWRAAVERSKNASQLALQVWYHILFLASSSFVWHILSISNLSIIVSCCPTCENGIEIFIRLDT